MVRIVYRDKPRWICEPPPQDALLPSWEHRTPEQCFRSVRARAYLQGVADAQRWFVDELAKVTAELDELREFLARELGSLRSNVRPG